MTALSSPFQTSLLFLNVISSQDLGRYNLSGSSRLLGSAFFLPSPQQTLTPSAILGHCSISQPQVLSHTLLAPATRGFSVLVSPVAICEHSSCCRNPSKILPCFVDGRGFQCIPCNMSGLPFPALHCHTKPVGRTRAFPSFSFFFLLFIFPHQQHCQIPFLSLIPSVQIAMFLLWWCHIWACSTLFSWRLSRARAFLSPGSSLRLTQVYFIFSWDFNWPWIRAENINRERGLFKIWEILRRKRSWLLEFPCASASGQGFSSLTRGLLCTSEGKATSFVGRALQMSVWLLVLSSCTKIIIPFIRGLNSSACWFVHFAEATYQEKTQIF